MLNDGNYESALIRATQAQRALAATPLATRLKDLRRVRQRIVETADEFCDAMDMPQRQSTVETITSELMPLCASIKYLERTAAKTLATRKLGVIGRPIWLWGSTGKVERVPLGNVLLLAPWNYPLLLAGVQASQAIAAGNAVLWKPALGCEAISAMLIDCFQSVFGEELVQQVDSSPDVAKKVIDAGVDKIVLTGSASTGRKVAASAAPTLTPATMELSGCDAMIVLDDADLDRVVGCIAFGLRFNSSATCIAPRRIFVSRVILPQLRERLEAQVSAMRSLPVHASCRQLLLRLTSEAQDSGMQCIGDTWDAEAFGETGSMRPAIFVGGDSSTPLASADIFAPITSIFEFDSATDLLATVHECPYALAASVFGSETNAREIASQLRVGTVTVNDIIVATADPRMPFGGRGSSGYGVTRGAEGLLEMTCPRVTMFQKLKHPVHLQPSQDSDAQLLGGVLRLNYGTGLRARWGGFKSIVRGILNQRKEKQ